jgi:hypothetical protein
MLIGIAFVSGVLWAVLAAATGAETWIVGVAFVVAFLFTLWMLCIAGTARGRRGQG